MDLDQGDREGQLIISLGVYWQNQRAETWIDSLMKKYSVVDRPYECFIQDPSILSAYLLFQVVLSNLVYWPIVVLILFWNGIISHPQIL